MEIRERGRGRRGKEEEKYKRNIVQLIKTTTKRVQKQRRVKLQTQNLVDNDIELTHYLFGMKFIYIFTESLTNNTKRKVRKWKRKVALVVFVCVPHKCLSTKLIKFLLCFLLFRCPLLQPPQHLFFKPFQYLHPLHPLCLQRHVTT